MTITANDVPSVLADLLGALGKLTDDEALALASDDSARATIRRTCAVLHRLHGLTDVEPDEAPYRVVVERSASGRPTKYAPSPSAEAATHWGDSWRSA